MTWTRGPPDLTGEVGDLGGGGDHPQPGAVRGSRARAARNEGHARDGRRQHARPARACHAHEGGEGEDGAAQDGDRRAGRRVGAVGEPQPRHAFERGERDRPGLERADAGREQAHRGGGHDEERAHEQGADGGQGGDDGHRDQREERQVGARGAHAERTPGGRVEPGGQPGAPEDARTHQREQRDAGRETHVLGPEADERPEQEPVHSGTGAVHVAGEHGAQGEGAHEQEAGPGVGRQSPRADRALEQGGEAEGRPQRAELGRDAPGPGDHEPRERRRADGVRVEGESAQDDPRAEQPARHGEEEDRGERALHEGRRERVGERVHAPSILISIIICM